MLIRYLLPAKARAYLDTLSGVTVALALIPEAIAFALVAHLSPLVGLFAAFFMCVIPALIGGRPGMISGATGSTAVVMISLVVQYGTDYLFAAVILSGILQIVFALLRVDKAVLFFSKSLMIGFVNGLALIVFFSQFHQFKYMVHGAEQWLPLPALLLMLGLVVFAMLIMFVIPKISHKIPAALTGILAVTIVVAIFGLHTRVVGDMLSGGGLTASFPAFGLPSVPMSWHTLGIIFPYALVIAIVALSETLITMRLVGEKTQSKSQPKRECIAQGVANTVSGLFGTMGGCAMIGQSMINITSGARGRLSGLVAGAALLVFILLSWSFIRLIPLAALVGVMFMVVYETFDWTTFRIMRQIPKHDIWIIVVVMLVTVSFNLAIAVVVGVVMAALKFCFDIARKVSVTKDCSRSCADKLVYRVRGPIFFVSAARFKLQFAPSDCQHKKVVIDFSEAIIYDHTAIDAIASLLAEYRAKGISVSLENLSDECQGRLTKARQLLC